jgi:hypothetical protein
MLLLLLLLLCTTRLDLFNPCTCSGNINITGTVFDGNYLSAKLCSLCSGAALMVSSSNSNPTYIFNSTFVNNYAPHGIGSAVQWSSPGNLMVENVSH